MNHQDLLQQYGPREAMDFDLVIVGGGPAGLSISNKRLTGYIDALTANNMPTDDSLIIHCEDLHEDPLAATQQTCAVDDTQYTSRLGAGRFALVWLAAGLDLVAAQCSRQGV